jgi:hypothetical protein
MCAVADQQATDVVGLEEPFVRVYGDRIGAVEVRDAIGVAHGESRRAAVGRVHVEPQSLRFGHVRQLADGVHGTGVGGSGNRRDRERPEARGAIACYGRRDRRAKKPEPLVRRDHDERLGREPELVQRPRDREMGLIRGVDAHAFEHRPARAARPQEPPESDVARQGHAHEVGHHAAEVSSPTRRRTRRVAQPSDDLLLDEGGDRPRVPYVDAMVGHLGEEARP